MKAAITQPNYLPWIGYFELLDKVDKWISLDDVQVVKRSFNVRNSVLNTDSMSAWLTLKLKKAPQKTNFNDAELDFSFVEDHLNKLKEYYRQSDFYSETLQFFEEILPPKKEEFFVAQYNTRLIKDICDYIGIELDVSFASQFKLNEGITAHERILNLCLVNNINEYFNFKSGIEEGLYKIEEFANKSILVYKQDYLHPIYYQHAKKFAPYLSLVDLLFNEGNNSALAIIRSGSNWIKLDK